MLLTGWNEIIGSWTLYSGFGAALDTAKATFPKTFENVNISRHLIKAFF